MRTCIIPTICYGIFYTGIQENGINLICQTLHQMYRRIIRNLPHHTHETHTAVLDRYHVEPPLVTLDKLANQAVHSLTTALHSVSTDDVIHLTDWRPLQSTRTLIGSRLCQPADFPDSDSAPDEIACIYCAFVAPTKPKLQRHMTQVHAQPRPLKRQVDYSQDTTNCMPQCKHCTKMFLKWSSFNSHCRANVCGAPSNSTNDTSTTLPLDWNWGDTVEMEPGPLHQEICDRALVFAVEADYASVPGDRRLCDYLQFHCILCSKHMSHTKAITAHVRSNHPAQLQEAIALGIQRMRQFTGNLSPCSFCMTSFNKTHLCPVFLQMAILELRAVTPDDPLHFTCFLCQFVAADRAQLKKHLTTLHQFPCHDWIPARDSLEDQVTCAHCGSVHHCQQALRKHITYGRCSQFDPARPWTGNGDADIVEQLPVGRIDLILADVEMKRRLTHDCQFCTQKFSQVSNLVGHLWKQRSELAEDGEQYRQVLRQRFAPRGCSCVPRIKQFRSTHTCVPFHQLSMIHFNGNALFNIPVVYDDAAARERMETHVPIRSFLLMHDALKTRDFELLQQDSTFRDSLSRHCLFCGKPVTLTGPAKEHVLRHHLQSMHPEPQQAIQCLIQMLIHRKGMITWLHVIGVEWQLCQLIPTMNTMTIPVLLHFVTWLLIPLTPSSHGSRARTCQPTGNEGEALPKMLSLMCQLVLRHERDLNCLHQQNTYVLFMSTDKDGLMPQIVQTSNNWKQQQQNHQVSQSLRQCLVLNLMQTLVQRVTKVMECKKEDPLWQSSLQSKIVLQDSSWPFLKWDHNKKSLELDAKGGSIVMKDLVQTLEQIYKLMERPEAIVRFHALQSKTKQAPVIPWRLELDMEDHKLRSLLMTLVNCSVWQLIQIRLKLHHQQQSRLADDLMKLTKKK